MRGGKIRVLLTGSKGQLGAELLHTCPADFELTGVDIEELDITDPQAVQHRVDEIRPHWIINAAAYTDVDRAEEKKELAFAVNADGAEFLAKAARGSRARLLQLSTDFVFPGDSGRPYRPADQPRAINAYGESKLAGERRVVQVLGDNALILRTSWLYSSHGNNFVKTMLRLMERERTLRVVADQVGSPTWACHLAGVVWALLRRDDVSGIHHWTDAGVASWYDFAVAIAEEAQSSKILRRLAVVKPIRSADYRSPARRPPFSVLDKTATWRTLGRTALHWRQCLRLMLSEWARLSHPTDGVTEG